MADLIDRKALIAEYDRVHIGPPGGARKLMEDAPTIDAVPVVRCKDCKHRRYHSCYREADMIEEMMAKKGVIFVHNAPTYPIRSLDDFCSYGERRTDV